MQVVRTSVAEGPVPATGKGSHEERLGQVTGSTIRDGDGLKAALRSGGGAGAAERCSSPDLAGAAQVREAGPLRLEDEEGIAFLREVLARSGYGEPAMFKTLGLPVGRAPAHPDLPLYLRRVRQSAPLHTLIKLFYLAVTVEAAEAEAAFAPHGWRRFAELGLLEEDGDGVQATCAISAHGRLRFAHDKMEPRTMESRSDYVLGLNPAARLLAALTPRRRVRSVLDLGTGCGVQAFLASAHAERVVATDICARALHFATFNATLNRIENVEFRLGSLFEPVGTETFDLFVSNPPYVISPDRDYDFRDGGMAGDQFCARLARQVGSYLVEGGMAVMLVHWANAEGPPRELWDAPVRRWLANNGCDTWLIRREVDDPLTYAADWNRQPDSAKYAAALDRWLGYFERQGIESVSMGALLQRRRTTGASWFRAEDTVRGALEGFGDQMDRLFAAVDFLGAHPTEEALGGAVFQPAGDHEVVRTLVPREGGYEVVQSRLRMPSGFCFEGSLDETAVRMLSLMDSRRSLSEIVQALVGAGGLDAAACAAIATDLVRRLVVLGFLVPVQRVAACGAPPLSGGSDRSVGA